jgi:hypothetical protein
MKRESVDPKLYEFATVRQIEIFDAVAKHGSMRAASRALGCNFTTVHQAVERVRRKAALSGYSPDHDLTRPVAPGQRLRGASTLYRRGEPEPVLQWVKSTADDEAREAIVREAVAVLSQECKGLAPITPPPTGCNADLLAVYPAGDPHFGLRTWAKEVGENFDLDIAKSLTLGAIDRLVSSAPAAETALLLPLGDVLHANDQTNATPASKHQLDVDGRFVKVLGATIDAYRHCIIRLLEKHSSVVVRFVAGNHDPEAVWSLAYTIAAYFDSDSRVSIDLSPGAHWFYRFGRVLIGATHGDKTKHDQLLGVMAADRAEDWGQTHFRYWYTGHVHHQSVREYPGVLCESFRTLAAKDSYAASYGYRSGRDMKCIVHHQHFGEVERHRVDVAMLQ